MQDMNSNNKLKRKKKATGPGNPSKRHRDRLNAELDNLARLLPFPEEIVTKLDKISILRLTVSYLRAKSFFQGCNGIYGNEETCEDLVQEFEGNGMFSQLSLEALDGFIGVITQEGQLFYVSENVRDFLGYSQAAVIHQSLFKFLHIDDQEMVRNKLTWPTKLDEDRSSKDLTNGSTKENGKTETSDDDRFTRAFTCRMKCTLNHGGGFYKLFKCVGRMREIHTKKRENKVTEYGLFAICSPAHNPNAHSSASVVKKEVAVTAQKRLERAQSDPLGNRRPPMAVHGGNVRRPGPLHLNPLRFPDKNIGPSPLSSPTSSLDSGHPTPDSTQPSRNGTDADVRSDISEISNSSDGDSKSNDRLLSALRNQAKCPNKNDRRKSVTFAHPGSRDEDDPRKRSRNVADPSDVLLNDSMDPLRRSQMYRGNLPSLQAEGKGEETRGTGELFGRKPLSSFDSRLDAARGLVSLGGMGMPYPGLFPFPDLMFPDVAFHNPMDFARMRNPFDMHGCCSPTDSYTSMAMRRWLSSPDMFRAPLSPLIGAQAGLLSAADRMRFFQYPFSYGFPFPGATPFDLNAGLSEVNLPEYSMRSGLYRNGQITESSNLGTGSKEVEQERRSPKSPKKEENTQEEAQKRKSPPSKEQKERTSDIVAVKKEKLDNEFEEMNVDNHADTEELKLSPVRKTTTKPMKTENGDNEDDENVDVVDPKSVCDLRQTLTGIQQEFTSRLENLKESFAQSLDGKFPGGTK